MMKSGNLTSLLLAIWFFTLVIVNPVVVNAENKSMNTTRTIDLLEGKDTIWKSPDKNRWSFEKGKIIGRTIIFPEIPTDDPDASSYLTSKQVFGGAYLSLSMEITFERSRYLGVFLDYDPETETGIWMATGHPIKEKEGEGYSEVEKAYIKTIDNGHWTVRATGQLDIKQGEPLRLRWEKNGQDYSIWQDEKLIATYRPGKKYEPGPVHFRLMSAIIEIDNLKMSSDWAR